MNYVVFINTNQSTLKTFPRSLPADSGYQTSRVLQLERHHHLALLAQAFNAQRHHVTLFQVERWLHTQTDAGRCAGGDDVTWHQRDGAKRPKGVDIEPRGRQALGKTDALLERLFDLLVIQRVRRTVDQPLAVGQRDATPGLQQLDDPGGFVGAGRTVALGAVMAAAGRWAPPDISNVPD